MTQHPIDEGMQANPDDRTIMGASRRLRLSLLRDQQANAGADAAKLSETFENHPFMTDARGARHHLFHKSFEEVLAETRTAFSDSDDALDDGPEDEDYVAQSYVWEESRRIVNEAEDVISSTSRDVTMAALNAIEKATERSIQKIRAAAKESRKNVESTVPIGVVDVAHRAAEAAAQRAVVRCVLVVAAVVVLVVVILI